MTLPPETTDQLRADLVDGVARANMLRCSAQYFPLNRDLAAVRRLPRDSVRNRGPWHPVTQADDCLRHRSRPVAHHSPTRQLLCRARP